MIWAGGGFAATENAVESGDDVVDVHAGEEARNALKIAGTAACDGNIADDVIIDFKFEMATADSLGCVFEYH